LTPEPCGDATVSMNMTDVGLVQVSFYRLIRVVRGGRLLPVQISYEFLHTASF